MKLYHTSGLLLPKPHDEYDQECIVMKDDYIVAHFFDGVDGEHSAEDNARLYAAAPEMLEWIIEEYNKMYRVYNMDKLKKIIELATNKSIEEIEDERD